MHLLTYHRAKGLEFEAVFLPRLEERELPSKLSKTADALAEERRLLYVGLTRAKRHLTVTWSGKPSRFLAELEIEDARAGAEAASSPTIRSTTTLKRWRLETAKAEERPAYVIFHNSTLAEIVRRAPRSREELAAVPGVGPAKLERYGEEVLAVLRRRGAPVRVADQWRGSGRQSNEFPDHYEPGALNSKQLPGFAHVRDARERARRRLDLVTVRLDVDEERARPEGRRGVDDPARLPRADRADPAAETGSPARP